MRIANAMVLGLSATCFAQSEIADRNASSRWPSAQELRALKRMEGKGPYSRDQAKKIASMYFEFAYGSCGGCLDPVETNTSWIFQCSAGIVGASVPAIQVSKSSGGVFCSGQRSFKDLRAFIQHLLTHPSSEPSR